ncbi:glycosyltransferase [Aliikangiella sp. IMCC44359]|uniref:glycosyltransferase n=1 Tax=Aliikangiella sp. IMCC44359 TaxID=3459125 RepID=UPI00403AD6A3
MKIIILCKQKPQGRCLYERPYGRFFHLAEGLSNKGHEVHFILTNYSNNQVKSKKVGNLLIDSVGIKSNPLKSYQFAKSKASMIHPDWFIGFSDTYYAIMASRLANQFNCQSLIDAYDNYESYIPWLKPLHWLYRKSLKQANAITAAGPELLKKMISSPNKTTKTAVIEMAADSIFTQKDKAECREKLNLPQNKILIGYCGSLHPNRGIDVLFKIIKQIHQLTTSIQFVFSGRKTEEYKRHKNVTTLGYVDDELMPDLYASLDLILSINKNSAFGNYSYPVKIYEALSSGIPVLASSTPSTQFVLKQNTRCLVEKNSESEFVGRILAFVQEPYEITPMLSGWTKQIDDIEQLLRN